MRKLASVQIINEIHPIENADAIEVAKVLGWHVVVMKKDNFRVGDKVVYVEIDSIMPSDDPRYDFLKNEGTMKRIKTISLRGQISQGIAFPMDILPEGNYEVDQDVTDILRITKYEPKIPECLDGLKKGDHPSFVPKSDETRVQILQPLLDKYNGELTYWTEKIDGTSATLSLKDNEFGVSSRNNEWIEKEGNLFWKVARKQNVEEKLRSLNMDIVLQGELFGAGIQDNKYKMQTQNIMYFNAFDVKNYSYFSFNEFVLLMKDLKLSTVPILGTDIPLINDIDTLVEQSIGKSVLNPKVHREGIVIRPMKEIKDSQFGRVSLKVINPKFLLGFKDA